MTSPGAPSLLLIMGRDDTAVLTADAPLARLRLVGHHRRHLLVHREES